MVRGYEYERGQYIVPLTAKALDLESSKVIDLETSPNAKVDPVYL